MTSWRGRRNANGEFILSVKSVSVYSAEAAAAKAGSVVAKHASSISLSSEIPLSSHCGCDILRIQLVTASSFIVSDPKILCGTPVFKGTRVPVRTLFEYLADGLSLEYFLESFPSVTRDQATDVLRLSQQRIEQEIAA